MTVAPPDSLTQVLEFLFEHDANDDLLYSHLERIDGPRLRKIIDRLGRVDAATVRGAAKAKKAFEGQRSALKGRLYEQLVVAIVDGVQCFISWSNVQTTTNELDVLVMLGPRSRWIPAMRDWGSHCICECKYHATHVSTNWVSKLNTVLQTHGASVGILFSKKGVATKGRGTQVRHTLQLLAAGPTPRFIICLDWADLVACANGERFLPTVAARYIEARAGLERLNLAAT